MREHHAEGSHVRPILAAVALWQRRQIRLTHRRRVVLLPQKSHVVGGHPQLLHHHRFVALIFRIRRKFPSIHIQLLFSVDLAPAQLLSLVSFLRLVPLVLRGTRRLWRRTLAPRLSFSILAQS